MGPPEAIEIERIAGIDVEGALYQTHCLVELTTAFGEHVAEVIEDLGVAGVYLNELSQGPLGISVPTSIFVQVGEGNLGRGVPRKRLRGRFEYRERLLHLAALEKRTGANPWKARIVGMLVLRFGRQRRGALVLTGV